MKISAYFHNLHLAEFIRALLLPGNRIWLFIGGIIGHCLMYSVGQIIIAYSNKYLVNAVTHKVMQTFWIAILLRAVVIIMMAVIYPVFIYLVERSLKRVLNDLRAALFARLERLPRTFFDRHKSGEILSLLINDFSKYENIYRTHLPGTIDALIWGLSSSVALFLLDWRLSMLVVSLGFLSAGALAFFSGPLRKIGDKMQHLLSVLTQFTENIVSGFQLLKLYEIRSTIMGKYVSKDNELLDLRLKRNRINAGMDSINDLLGRLTLLGVLLVGSYMVTIDECHEDKGALSDLFPLFFS